MVEKTLSREDALLERVLQNAGRGPYHFARAYRVMPSQRPYGIFTRPYVQPYLWDVYEYMRTLKMRGRIVVMKCAGTGWSESAINMAVWVMAVKHEGVLYMLPTESALSDFAQARLSPLINNSPMFRQSFSSADNVGLKIGFGFPLYLRGAKSQEKLREIPVGLVVRDEKELMGDEGAALALTRLGASFLKWVYDISNPRYPETGIHKDFLQGTQEEFVIECPRCGLTADPVFPESVSEKFPETIVCPDCHMPLDVEERWRSKKAMWRAAQPDAPFRSFHMNQLLSPTIAPWEVAKQWEESKNDIAKLQTFYNFTLGVPYAPAGSRLTDEIISKLPRREYMASFHQGPCALGVDVGSVLHVVARLHEGGTVWAGTVDWDELRRLMGQLRVDSCCIDIAPETTEAKRFASDFPGRVTLVRYKPSATATGMDETSEGVYTRIDVARTELLDRAMSRFIAGEEAVPPDLPAEFWTQVKAITRRIVSDGEKTYATWSQAGPDHYAHAFAYSELARRPGGILARTQIFPPGKSEKRQITRPSDMPLWSDEGALERLDPSLRSW